MDRRSLLLGTAGLAANLAVRTSWAAAAAWSPELRRYVRNIQEREYLRLADALGLSSAKAAYEKIALRPMPIDLERQYGSEVLPTPYEDPYLYPAMTKIFEGLSHEALNLGIPPLPGAFLATLVSGDVEARSEREPTTGTPIIFFEQGLFSYFLDMAKVTAWAAPPISLQQLADDDALKRLPRSYTIPPQSSQYFAATLYSYAVNGTRPITTAPLADPPHNTPLAILLLNHMERFAMAHELAHLHENHLSKAPTPEIEYEADALAVILVTSLARAYHGSWAIGFWASELALIALNFLHRAVGFFTFGPEKLAWISSTHPDPLSRRQELFQRWLDPRAPANGVAAARELSGMTEALLQKLWEICLPAWAIEYQRGARASPRWRKLAGHFQLAAAPKR